MISGGFSAAYDALLPQFEASRGVKVVTVHGPSMGATPQAIPNRLARGEAADVVILADSALGQLIEQNRVLPASRTELVRSVIAMAVREGAPVPPDTNKGHFHTEWTEFWFIMEGKIGYKIEGYPYFTSEPGDVVTAARGRWHRAGNDPSAPMSTRIPINPRPVILHNFEPAH